MNSDDKLFLLDAYALIYRAYYAFIKNPRINSKGFNTSAILGFVNTLEEVLKKENPSHIGVAFDPAGPTFRHEAYEQYKAQREETPEAIRPTIVDGAFVGDGCAISQASADIMLGMIVGKKKDEALKMGETFMRMIKGEATDEEIESLEEASALKDISHMPARVKCAVLGWRTLKEAVGEHEE